MGLRIALVVGGLLLFAGLGAGMIWTLTRGAKANVGPPAFGEEDRLDGTDEDLKAFARDDRRPRGAKPKLKPLIVLDPEEEKQVKDMTDKGIGYLRRAQQADGCWSSGGEFADHLTVGKTAMAALTLLSCGVDRSDDAIQRAVQFLRVRADRIERTYDLSLCILLLDKLHEKKEGEKDSLVGADRELLDSLTYRLIAGQTRKGGWYYECRLGINPGDRPAVALALKQLARHGNAWIKDGFNPSFARDAEEVLRSVPPHLQGLPVFTMPTAGPGDDFWRQGGPEGGDNSNTQFAVLALWASRKHGLPVDRSLQFAVKRFKCCQNGNGSWNYEERRDVVVEPTMTCAGLLALAVELGLRDKEAGKSARPEDNPAIQSALVHVANVLNTPPDPGARTHYPVMYFLWSVERVGVLYQQAQINGKDWYRWGLRILRDHQRDDGSWPQSFFAATEVSDTCFGLLFLHRVNLAADLTDQLQGLGGRGGS